MKIIHITDTHLVAPGVMLYDLDPYERLRLCIDDVVANHADARFCVITSDLAHKGEEAAYRGLRTQLERLPMPWYPLLGNHDARAPFAAVFPDVARDEAGFVQSALRQPEGDFLFYGHVHRPVCGSWHRIPVSTMRELNHQVPFDFVTTTHVRKSHEPPAYAVVFVEAALVTVHFHDYLDRRTLVKDGEHRAYAP